MTSLKPIHTMHRKNVFVIPSFSGKLSKFTSWKNQTLPISCLPQKLNATAQR